MGEMFSSFDGTKLYLNKEVPEGAQAAAVIVHGLCEHQGRYDYFAERFHKAGIATYRFDHRGHGRSEGERTYYTDFNELLDDTNVVVDMALQENPDIPVFLIGHSMGGFTVSLYGVKYPDKNLRGIITSGALTHDNGKLITGIPKGMDPHEKLPNELGSGVCSVAEVVDWYGKDPYNTQTFTAGLVYALCDGLERHGIAGAKKGFARAIELMKQVPYDRSRKRPQVLIVGEYLLNFHPGANHDIEAYLERNGFEIIEAHMTDVIRKTYFTKDMQNQEYHLSQPLKEKGWYRIADQIFEFAHDAADRIAAGHPLYTPPTRLPKLVKESDAIIQHTFDTGEGVLIPAEIIHYAKEGCRSFVILQPFGCLPNHIVGKGVIKELRRHYPQSNIIAVDYDPGASEVNQLNRIKLMLATAQKNLKPKETDNSGDRYKDGGSEESRKTGYGKQGKTAKANVAAASLSS